MDELGLDGWLVEEAGHEGLVEEAGHEGLVGLRTEGLVKRRGNRGRGLNIRFAWEVGRVRFEGNARIGEQVVSWEGLLGSDVEPIRMLGSMSRGWNRSNQTGKTE